LRKIIKNIWHATSFTQDSNTNRYVSEIEKDNEGQSTLMGMVYKGESMQYLMSASALTLFSLEN
jgi:hypothetical protein